jgi:hypothetical protein
MGGTSAAAFPPIQFPCQFIFMWKLNVKSCVVAGNARHLPDVKEKRHVANMEHSLQCSVGSHTGMCHVDVSRSARLYVKVGTMWHLRFMFMLYVEVGTFVETHAHT